MRLDAFQPIINDYIIALDLKLLLIFVLVIFCFFLVLSCLLCVISFIFIYSIQDIVLIISNFFCFKCYFKLVFKIYIPRLEFILALLTSKAREWEKNIVSPTIIIRVISKFSILKLIVWYFNISLGRGIADRESTPSAHLLLKRADHTPI